MDGFVKRNICEESSDIIGDKKNISVEFEVLVCDTNYIGFTCSRAQSLLLALGAPVLPGVNF